MLNSPYRNKCLTIETRRPDDAILPGRPTLSLARVDNQKLSGILLPERVMTPIKLFIDAIKQHPKLKLPMRYLLSGRPGTGKTRIIQAVANEAKGHATFIFADGSEECLNAAFELADVLSPMVVCIDDVDLVVGARDEGIYSQRLASFLQNLDGFVRQDFFLLATANDKRFVDLAARRPGRFDRVIDVDIIDSDQYLSLARTKTNNEHILSLFDEAILDALERKRVTGAFVANLVKQLEVMDRLSPGSLTGTDVKELIEELNEGFNEKGVSETRVGFGLQN
jgi:SpoVK/Ycf46/Vps4 family AAA+-type ATPase